MEVKAGEGLEGGGPTAELRRSVSLKLAITARQLRRHFDKSVSELGVTRSQWTIISAVARLPGATQRTLAQLLEMSEASAGRLVDRLCSEKLLERRPKDDDRRAHCVFLTSAGEALISQLAKIAGEHEAVAFKNLDAAELQNLDGLLDHIVGNLAKRKTSG
jgi:MarR family transcriptional regulator for hemolysin